MDHARAKFARKGSDLQVVNEVGTDLTFGLKIIRDKDVVHKLFAEIGPSFATRDGGYTRIIKTAPARATTPRWRSSSWSTRRPFPLRRRVSPAGPRPPAVVIAAPALPRRPVLPPLRRGERHRCRGQCGSRERFGPGRRGCHRGSGRGCGHDRRRGHGRQRCDCRGDQRRHRERIGPGRRGRDRGSGRRRGYREVGRIQPSGRGRIDARRRSAPVLVSGPCVTGIEMAISVVPGAVEGRISPSRLLEGGADDGTGPVAAGHLL